MCVCVCVRPYKFGMNLLVFMKVVVIFLSGVEKNEKFVPVVSTCSLMLIACSQNQVHLEMINVSLKLVSGIFCVWERQYLVM